MGLDIDFVTLLHQNNLIDVDYLTFFLLLKKIYHDKDIELLPFLNPSRNHLAVCSFSFIVVCVCVWNLHCMWNLMIIFMGWLHQKSSYFLKSESMLKSFP